MKKDLVKIGSKYLLWNFKGKRKLWKIGENKEKLEKD